MIPNEEREGDGVNTRSLTSNRISSLYPSDVDWLAILLPGMFLFCTMMTGSPGLKEFG